MATPIDIFTNSQWKKATYVRVVGRTKETLQDFEQLVFPQEFHDTTTGKGNSPCIHPLRSKEGENDVFFTNREIDSLKEEVKFTLVGKFQLGHPKMELVRNYFESLKFIGDWKIGLIYGRHLLIQLAVEEDYARLFAKQYVIIVGTTMKIMKWTPDFDPSKEPPVVPLWFELPGLPLPYFKLNALFNIGRALGTPLKVDAPTFNKARPALARIQVERDITFPELKRIWIGSDIEGFWQEIVAEQKIYYFQHCKLFGHTVEKCYRLHPPPRRNVGGDQKDVGGAPLKVTEKITEGTNLNIRSEITKRNEELLPITTVIPHQKIL
ncbi:uncharacterized protein LOC110035862 [Phalaenopsis equestris]|uniref:uncharacterized protein LOC110035862 n=1 Tax=Phalaenopsis equestris TaxID=78828 RepID=UPI0009E1C554|nr:uncharacterized protein LOC110035862 [Phalaenopsis equestris]